MAFPTQIESGVTERVVVLGEANGIRDFDLAFYPLNVSEMEVACHVEAYMGEKLLAPRMEQLLIGRDKQLDPSYLLLMSRAIAHAKKSGNTEVVDRYEKELEGMQGLVEIVVESGIRGEPLPVVVLASDPGRVYVDQDGKKKSKTFLAMLVEAEEGGWRYKIFDLPTKYIGLEKHWEILERLGNIGRTEKLLQKVLTEVTPGNVVAYPVILDELNYSLDQLATELGYKNWEDVEEQAGNQLALEGDARAIPRRKSMVKDFTNRIVRAVRSGATTQAKEALVNAMADMFAMEKGAEFVGMDGEEILGEIEKTVRVALADRLGIFTTTSWWGYQASIAKFGMSEWELEELWSHRAWMRQVFEVNPLAQEARATGCGGVGISMGSRGSESWFGVSYQSPAEMSYAGFDLGKQFGYEEAKKEVHSDSDGGSVEWVNGKPVGTVKEEKNVGCPLCKSCDVTAFYTSTHICCGSCHGAVRKK